MGQNSDWIAGAVVVSGLILSLLGLISYGVWDLLRQYRGITVSITASSWIAKFLIYHPIAAFLAGLVVGILASHFGWPQSVHPNIVEKP